MDSIGQDRGAAPAGRVYRLVHVTAGPGVEAAPVSCLSCGERLDHDAGRSMAIECPRCGHVQRARRRLSALPEFVSGGMNLGPLTFPLFRPPHQDGPILVTELTGGKNHEVNLRCAGERCQKLLGVLMMRSDRAFGVPPLAGLLVLDIKLRGTWEEPSSELRTISEQLRSNAAGGALLACRKCQTHTLSVLQRHHVVTRRCVQLLP